MWSPSPWGPTMPFQSHAGSIEAPPSLRDELPIVRFQSHAGSIEAPGAAPAGSGTTSFQSHAGSIEASASETWISRISSVSIPRWFD